MKMWPTEQPGITLSYRSFVFSQLRAEGFCRFHQFKWHGRDDLSARPSERSLVVVKCRLLLSLTVSSSYWADLANQTTGLTNGWAANWAPEVEFSPFRALCRPSNDVPVLLLNQPITELRKRRFWATQVTQMWGLFFFIMPWRYQIVFLRVVILIETICPKIKDNHSSWTQKGHFRLTCIAQKRLCVSSLFWYFSQFCNPS